MFVSFLSIYRYEYMLYIAIFRRKIPNPNPNIPIFFILFFRAMWSYVPVSPTFSQMAEIRAEKPGWLDSMWACMLNDVEDDTMTVFSFNSNSVNVTYTMPRLGRERGALKYKEGVNESERDEDILDDRDEDEVDERALSPLDDRDEDEVDERALSPSQSRIRTTYDTPAKIMSDQRTEAPEFPDLPNSPSQGERKIIEAPTYGSKVDDGDSSEEIIKKNGMTSKQRKEALERIKHIQERLVAMKRTISNNDE